MCIFRCNFQSLVSDTGLKIIMWEKVKPLVGIINSIKPHKNWVHYTEGLYLSFLFAKWSTYRPVVGFTRSETNALHLNYAANNFSLNIRSQIKRGFYSLQFLRLRRSNRPRSEISCSIETVCIVHASSKFSWIADLTPF